MNTTTTDRDLTDLDMRAAIIDQTVAGTFGDATYAYVALADAGLGIAVANERGYHPVGTFRLKDYAEAQLFAAGLNKHIGLSTDDAIRIVISTMGGQRYAR